ncbi:MAG: hypothetical protein WDN28_26595 [Chthoniobacter sp.]
MPDDPRVLWKIDAGPGQSSPVISGGKVIYLDAQQDQESLIVWTPPPARSSGTRPRDRPWNFLPLTAAARVAPRSSMATRAYLQSSGGEFSCLSMADGKKIWGVSFGKDYGATFLGNKTGDPAAKETASRRTVTTAARPSMATASSSPWAARMARRSSATTR